MRLENLELSQAIFEKLVGLDSMDRIGAKGLLELVIKRKEECSPLNRDVFKGQPQGIAPTLIKPRILSNPTQAEFLLPEQDHV